MTNEQSGNLRIRISREVEGTHIEVTLDNENQLGEACELLARLCENIKIQDLKLSLTKIWIEEKDSLNISEIVSESIHRVVLSLFRNWPDVKRVSNIQAETGLSQGSVSNILAGRQGGMGEWFAQEGDCWNLSQMGLDAIAETIAPPYLQLPCEEE